MIPRTAVSLQSLTPVTTIPAWQSELARAVSDPAELLRLLGLEQHPALTSNRTFPLRVPHSFIARMRHGDANDPLLRQVLPLGDEDIAVPGYAVDPVGDAAAHAAPGVLHKYRGRALLVTTGACAVHCRYCFRRHFPYAQANARSQDWEPALAYLHNHPDLNEVILSGGDPWVLPDRQLAALVNRLEALPHITRLRIHTRLPIVLPSRVDADLLSWLDQTRLQKVVVVHVNHAREIDASVRQGLTALRDAGATLLNQSVLLRGINDTATDLADLSEALFAAGVMPYYLHTLDKVAGAAHFDLPREGAIALHRELQAMLPGYLVPRLVTERAGEAHKLWLGAQTD